MKKVSIIIPIVRSEKAARCIEAIKADLGEPGGRYELLAEKDEYKLGCPQMVRRLTEDARHDLVLFLGDDTIPEPGFLDAALAVMDSLPDGWGVVGLNTQDPDGGNDHAHFLAHKRMLEHIPGGAFFSLDYRHAYGDVELTEIANELGRWGFAEEARIQHDHPINGGADDQHYASVYSEDAAAYDRWTYQRRKQDRKRKLGYDMPLAIAWPLTNQVVYGSFAISYARLEKPSHMFLVPQMANQLDVGRSGIAEARQHIADAAMMAGCSHLLMMDTDQCYLTRDLIPRLMGHGLPIVAARVHMRYPPFSPLLRYHDGQGYLDMPYEQACACIQGGEVVEVDATGFGCIMIDCRVLAELQPPWFEWGPEGKGEDILFCERAKAAGYKIHVDCGVEVTHLATTGVGAGEYQLYHSMRRSQNGTGKQAGFSG